LPNTNILLVIDPNLKNSAFVVVTDDNPKSPRDDDSISEEEPEELPGELLIASIEIPYRLIIFT
jgi:hypothetical protein